MGRKPKAISGHIWGHVRRDSAQVITETIISLMENLAT